MASSLMPDLPVAVVPPPATPRPSRTRAVQLHAPAATPNPRADDDVSVLPLFATAAEGDDSVRRTDPAFLRSPSSAIEHAFRAFHLANPHVYRELERMALEALSQLQADGVPRKRLGISAFFEVLRYQRWLHTTTDDGGDYRLNNNLRALFARLLVWRHPKLDGVIELRERRERNAHDDAELLSA